MEDAIWSALVAGLVGFGLAFAASWTFSRHQRQRARGDADSIVSAARREADALRREKESELQIELDRRRGEMDRKAKGLELEIEAKLKEIRSHEESLAALDHELRRREEKIERELSEARDSKRHLEEMERNVRRTMANLASMDVEEIKDSLRRQVEAESAQELKRLRRGLLERSQAEVEREAKTTLLAAMQRLASRPNSEMSASVVSLPNDDMKGRIIGREGRNIKCFETATGTTLLIDESPNLVLVSSFDPVRREIAKVALERLVQDGRIHPATIEERVAEARADIDRLVADAGEAAIDQLKVAGLHPETVALLGRLKFRTAYAQNVLEHSIEVAFLCSLIASELGLDPRVAKRAGLLHDIGKSIEGEREGSHAAAGAAFVKARGEESIVVNAIAAHHEEVPPASLYAGVVMLADAISAARPGARSESIASYIDRLRELESLAKSFCGVDEAYAIQAGREVRVVVNPRAVDDAAAAQLSCELRERIEEQLHYPSSIRITVIREQRFVDTAK